MENAKYPVNAVSPIGTLTHRELILRAGGPAEVGRLLDPPVSPNTVKQWSFNDSIPGPYFQAFADAKIASLEELAAAAEAKRRASVPGSDEAAA